MKLLKRREQKTKLARLKKLNVRPKRTQGKLRKKLVWPRRLAKPRRPG